MRNHYRALFVCTFCDGRPSVIGRSLRYVPVRLRGHDAGILQPGDRIRNVAVRRRPLPPVDDEDQASVGRPPRAGPGRTKRHYGVRMRVHGRPALPAVLAQLDASKTSHSRPRDRPQLTSRVVIFQRTRPIPQGRVAKKPPGLGTSYGGKPGL